MTRERVRCLAIWLLEHLAANERRDSLIGDLLEQHQRGRSATWLGRQVVSAISINLVGQVRAHGWLIVCVACMGLYLDYAYMFLVRPGFVATLDRWYPALIDWLIRHEMDGARHLVYDLHLGDLTRNVAYCTFCAAIASILSRVFPRQMRLVVLVFLLSQIAVGLRWLPQVFWNVVEEPGKQFRYFNLFWYCIFSLVEVPLAILAGGVWRSIESTSTDPA